MSKIYLISEFGGSYGFGHLHRSYTLCKNLKIIKNIIPILKNHSKKSDLVNDFVFENEIQYINQTKDILDIDLVNATVIMDFYSFNIKIINIAIMQCKKSFFIADIHKKIPKTDVLINHLPWANRNDYKSKKTTKFFLGTEYAIIRNEFYNKPINSKGRVLICLGNSDDIIELITRIHGYLILKGYDSKMIDIVYKDKISALNSNVYNNISAKKVFKLISKSELCLISPGNISYEVFKVGRNCIIGCLNKGQQKVSEKFEKLNLCNYIGYWSEFDGFDLSSIKENSKKIISSQHRLFKENNLNEIIKEI